MAVELVHGPYTFSGLHVTAEYMHIYNPFPLILTPPPPNNKTSPLLHIGTVLGGFNIGGLGGVSIYIYRVK